MYLCFQYVKILQRRWRHRRRHARQDGDGVCGEDRQRRGVEVVWRRRRSFVRIAELDCGHGEIVRRANWRSAVVRRSHRRIVCRLKPIRRRHETTGCDRRHKAHRRETSHRATATARRTSTVLPRDSYDEWSSAVCEVLAVECRDRCVRVRYIHHLHKPVAFGHLRRVIADEFRLLHQAVRNLQGKLVLVQKYQRTQFPNWKCLRLSKVSSVDQLFKR